ncbi:hypothetical protein E0Z10_g7486 [Xylaria hypoxylon]|uniref:Major facilitator superfamily (MFS) profile domain-containing protein n=1 Tax=Xylaria hypoxylon TaxID=37992 RepID=A0A4Z0YDR2_9PEZI|nr:hypothetical protein E0Z10_g7486 [Xylaria hypoxylon]
MDEDPERNDSRQKSTTTDQNNEVARTENGITEIDLSPPYSAFSTKQKKGIVALVAFAGWFSSLSSFIYFPAIPFIAAELGVSIEKINLTVTAYLIASGIFPSLVGEAADTIGRRPVLIGTLIIYVAANVGLALQSSFGLLFFLRIVQSAGISGSYAVTYGVVGDLFTPAERGGYSGIVSFVLNTPPSIGPIISGLLMTRWDWRAIFWFLSAISPICLVFVASLSSLFTQVYQVSGLVSGLTYIPFGVACAISAIGTGKILDIDYRHTAAKYGLSAEKSKNHDLDHFPIEEARLRSLKYSLLVCGLLIVGYGWLLQYQVNIAAPLVFQFLIGLSIQGVFTALSTLLVDIHPDASSTAQAASNFIRAELAAGGLALLDIILRGIGAGWTFVLFAVLGLLSLPWLHVLRVKGLQWRQHN